MAKGKKFGLGILIGAVVGVLTGLLTAPKSGKETRQDIKVAAEKGISEAEKQLKKVHTQLAALMNEAKDKATTLQGAAQKELQSVIAKTNSAKEKARMLLSASHEGKADDKDLQKAIDEANKAIEHLQAYLKK